MRLLPFAFIVFAFAPAHAARVAVVLPEDAGMRVVDRSPPPEGPRIDCPGLCVHEIPGNAIDIFDLRVDVLVDPRTGDPPWDVVAMDGCRGTSALPAPTGLCFLPFEGDATIKFEVRYRPVLAVTVGGTMADGLAAIFITGGPGPGYQGAGASFSCNMPFPTTQTCARHLSPDQPVLINAPSTELATFVEASPPCGAQSCEFVLEGDTCISYLYLHARPPPFPEIEISGPECPTGPGIGGSGGGGGLPPEFVSIKELALARMRLDFEQALYPCLTATTGLSIFFSVGPTIGPVIGGTMLAAAGPLCVSLVKRIIDLQKIYDDPPDFDFHEVAALPRSPRAAIGLPSCRGLARDEKRVCKRLSSAVRSYAKKGERATAIVEALRITVERASGAHQAGDDRALEKQLRAARKRVNQLEAALEKKAKVGARIAAVLADAETTAPLGEMEFAEAGEAVLARLAEGGLPDADARSALEPVLAPRAIDLVTLFGEP